MNKLERLFAMTIYMLNRERVTALELAERYDVSIRTIQRDIDALTLANIPIISYAGVNGGYEIMASYRMHVQLGSEEDYRYIQIAMQGLMSAFQEPKLDAAMEKVNALHVNDDSHMVLDFGVLKEKPMLNEYLNVIHHCIHENKVLSFTYCNSKREVTRRKIEPMYVIYRWYSWYVISYDLTKQDFRCFKLIRMSSLHMENVVFQHREHDKEAIIQRVFTNNSSEMYEILVYCDSDCDLINMEYLNGEVIETKENQDYIMRFHLPKEEEAWKGTLLSYADKIKIISPNEVKDVLLEKIHTFLSNHDNRVS